jgi:RNA polymerase sigma-70 factor (ECF subfamily)
MAIRTDLNVRPMDLNAIVADQAAFREWYEMAMPLVYQYLLSRNGHDVALAEELTQQTFVAALRQRSSYDGRSDVVTWLCAIGRHKLVDHLRRSGRDRQRHRRRAAEWTDGAAGFWAGQHQRASVEAGLANLPGEERAVMVLRYLDGLSVREIAHTIGRSEKETESLLSRARDGFRHAYGTVNQ